MNETPRSTRHLQRKLAAVALSLGALVLAGCGSSSSGTTASTASTAGSPAASTPATTSTSSSSSSTAPSGSLSLAANPEGQLAYNKKTLTASAGKVTIDFTNSSPLDHNMTIESSSHKIIGATPTFQGGTKPLTVELKPGTYKFFCSVPGHRMAGMEGTLTVK
jgi:plastocyanin